MVLMCRVVFGLVFIAVSMNFVISQRNNVPEKIPSVISQFEDLEDRSNLHPTYICKVCNCKYKSQILECDRRDKDSHFRKADWIILKTADFNISIANFSRNRIETLLPFPEIELKTLDLSHNEIYQIADYAFENLNQMETLDLSYNQLEFLNSAVFQGQESNQSLASIKTLLLGNNFLTILHEDVLLNLMQLNELKLNNNPLKAVYWANSAAINNMYYFQISLMHLDLSYTQVNDLSKNTLITSFNKLNTLNLKGNLFTAVPYELNSVKELEVLILDENPIETLRSGSFPIMKSLKELHMSNMSRLTSVERNAIYNLTALEKLYLTDNLLLSHINMLALMSGAERSGVYPLKELYLRNNNLKTFDSYTVQNWNQLTKLELRDNPWTCYCEDSWLTDPVMLSIYEADPTIATNILCYEPAEMMGLNIQTILNDDYNDYERSCIKMSTDEQPNTEEPTDAEDEDNTLLIVLLLGCSIASPIMLALFVMYKRGCLNFSNTSRTPSEYSEYLYKKTDAKDDDMSD